MKVLLSIISRIAGSGLAVACAAPVAQQVYLKSSNSGVSDAFGSAVAVSGDTMVIGAPAEDGNSTGVNGSQTSESALQSGAAYVFVRSGNTWTQQAYLKASNTGAYDSFGWSVAISGDTIVVGANQEDSSSTTVNGSGSDNSASNAGAAYVFQRSGTVWTQQAYLKASNAQAGDLFGSAVAVSGDSVVVGANREGSNATGVNGDAASNGSFNSGAAYVFHRNGTSWTQQAYLKASDTAASAEFGSSVAVDGGRVVIGAPLADGYRGALYVFSRSLAAWSQQARLTASNAAPAARFGCAVAVSGDTIAAGARGESSGVTANPADTSAPEAGAAYVFKWNGPLWTEQAYLKASNPGAGDFFGKSLSLDGDTLVVGAFGEDSAATGVDGNQASNSASAAGAAYVYSRSVNEWFPAGYLKASNSEASDWFGGAVAVSADTVVAGAARESGGAWGVNGLQNGNGALNSGAAYGFIVPPPGAPEIAVEPSAAPELSDGSGVVAFAPSATGQVMTRSFTVRNSGSGPLVVTGYAVGGADPASFTVEAGAMPLSVLPGEEEILHVHFHGAAAGSYGATVQLMSNDADESPFDIGLAASAVSATSLYDAWTGAAGLAGPAAGHDATPFQDGVENLLKYAFNLDGSGPDRRRLAAGGDLAGLPVFRFEGSGAQAVFRAEFLRRKGSGITYTPMISSTLAAGSFVPMTGTTTVTDLGSQWERVRLDQPRNPATHPRGFGVVEVSLP
jgi:FG-GAP repeat